ncbi:MAG: 3-deoxy-D-manno-octulosonic acid transferase [Flavobacteriales bacterium]
MTWIYSFFIRLYGLGILLASKFNPKAKAWVDGRKDWSKNLRLQLPEGRKIIWFHCASLGEFDQGLPLMKSMKEADPQLFLLVSFFSPSGMQHYQKREAIVDAACYLPLDTWQNARKFIEIVQPEKAIFIKYEFWPNFLYALSEKQIPTFAVSAIFRPNQHYFRWYGHFFRKALKRIQHFYVQNQESLVLLASIGIDQCTVSGDLRYSRVIQAKQMAMDKPNELLRIFTEGHTTLILGSSWPKEETIVSEALQKLGGIKLIIAPHDVGEGHIQSIVSAFPSAIRYTQLDLNKDHLVLLDSSVLIIDCIGLLSAAYRYGTISFIGGGFTGNLHNILEPAVYGLPLLFGPKHQKFPEATIFLQKGFALEVRNSDEFQKAFHSQLCRVEIIRNEMETFVHSQVKTISL